MTLPMRHVPIDDVRLLLRIARDSTLGGTFDERMALLATSVSKLVPAMSMTAWTLAKGGALSSAHFWNCDREALVDYVDHYRQFDPMGPGVLEARGELQRLSDLLPAERFGADPFTADLCGAVGVRWIVGATARTPDDGRVALALQRGPSDPDFTRRDLVVLELILPDLVRAAFGADLAEQVRCGRASGLELDGRGEVTRAVGDGATLLRALGPAGSAALAAAARELLGRPGSPAGRAACLVLAAGPGRHLKVTLTVQDGAAAHARVLAALAPVQPGTEEFFLAAAAAAGLTALEREVAALALRGLGNRGIAFELEASESTVKFHLANVFRKTGAGGRVELGRALLGQSM